MTDRLRLAQSAREARTALDGPIDCEPDLTAELAELDRELDFELTELAELAEDLS